ncbi:MAG TPA: carboxypeptidase-like regulatory domain-containing protein [Nitrospiria bacterium]|nr:carboxypeptidase-like regulatory domain-containing protein [Nitrospiria bacterium]
MSSRLLILGVVLSVLAGSCAVSMAAEYKEAVVTDGGTISGKVTLKGAIPDPRVFPVVLYPFGEYCKKISDGHGNIHLEEFVVSPEGGLQDTVVAVQEVPRGKPFVHVKSELVAVNCMFHPADVPDSEQFIVGGDKHVHHAHPLVMVLENHRPISVTNKDPIVHNGQVFQSEKGNILLNFPLPVSNDPRGGVLNFEKGKRISEMICGMHEFMQSWGFVVDNPYYARTKRDGLFAIDQLPPGTYRVLAWHPHFQPIEREVTVPAGGSVTMNFEFDSAKIQRPIYERQDKYRMGPEAKPEHHLMGCEGPYCTDE